MQLTAEEKLMYEVMKAIYDSGIPISFKGAMVLKAFLNEAGFTGETRHTADIDANWAGNAPPSSAQMTESLQNAIAKSGIDLKVGLYRTYGEGRSAGFELFDGASGEVLFTMDVDVGRPAPQTKVYEIGGVRFRGVSPVQMTADKLSALSTNRVFSRIKDLADLYCISGVFPFDKKEVLYALEKSGRKLSDFDAFLNRRDELKHAYEKFRFAGEVDKPPFEEVYKAVKAYIKDLLPAE